MTVGPLFIEKRSGDLFTAQGFASRHTRHSSEYQIELVFGNLSFVPWAGLRDMVEKQSSLAISRARDLRRSSAVSLGSTHSQLPHRGLR